MKKNKVGRPQKKLNIKQIEKLAMMHCTNEEIASFFDVSKDTITRNYANIIDKGKGKGKIRLRRYQWQQAVKSYSMSIWLGKQYLEQSDKMEHGGKVGLGIEFVEIKKEEKLSTGGIENKTDEKK